MRARALLASQCAGMGDESSWIDCTRMPFDSTALIITLGALAGGFVAGLAGFGTVLTASGIWLHVLDPATTTVLALMCSVTTQITTFSVIWREIQPARVLPFVIPGLIGVPAGILLLRAADPGAFKLWVGLLIMLFAAVMLAWRGQRPVTWGGRGADAGIGFLGGVLGGFCGMSGPLPTLWATMRAWSKDQKRSIFQSFNAAILFASLIGHLIAGHAGTQILWMYVLALPGTLLGTWAGVQIYKRLSDRNFTDLVMALLFVSGLVLVWAGW